MRLPQAQLTQVLFDRQVLIRDEKPNTYCNLLSTPLHERKKKNYYLLWACRYYYILWGTMNERKKE